MGAKIVLYSGEPGLYWSQNTISSTACFEEEWEKIDFANDDAEEILRIAQNANSFAIITNYAKEDINRCTFIFNILNGGYKYGYSIWGEDDGSVRPSLYQTHFLLAFKDKIDVIINKKRELYPDLHYWGITANEIKRGEDCEFIAWTNTFINEGDEGNDNGILWMVDINHNSSRIDFKNSKHPVIPIFNADAYERGYGKEYYTKQEILEDEYKRYGAFYSEQHPNNVDTLFYPLKEDMVINATPRYLSFNFDDGSDERKSFFIKIEQSNEMKSGTWDNNEKTLTKYQWEIFLAHKDLVDKVYTHLNEEKEVGTLDIYGIPDLVWTSTDYIAKENTVGYYETQNKDGKGIKWVVCPSLRTSQIVFKKKTECNYPIVGIWE